MSLLVKRDRVKVKDSDSSYSYMGSMTDTKDKNKLLNLFTSQLQNIVNNYLGIWKETEDIVFIVKDYEKKASTPDEDLLALLKEKF